MRRRVLELFGVAAAVAGVTVLLQLAPVPVEGQAPQEPPDRSDAEPAAPTPWGEPDLQGIWTTDYEIPLERPARFADREFLTDEERAELDRERARIIGLDCPARGARQRAGRGRRLQRGDLPVPQVHGPPDVADHRSAERPDPAADAGGGGAPRRHPRVPARVAPGHRGLPRQPAVLRGRPVRTAVAAPERAAAVLSGDRRRGGRLVQPVRPPGGSRPRRAVHVGQAAGLRRRGRVLPADRAVVRDRVDLLRYRPGAGLAAGHPDHGPPASAAARPPVVGRLARALGRRHAGGRRHQLQLPRPTTRARGRTCTWWSAGGASTRRPWSTWSRWRIRRRGRRPGRLRWS